MSMGVGPGGWAQAKESSMGEVVDRTQEEHNYHY